MGTRSKNLKTGMLAAASVLMLFAASASAEDDSKTVIDPDNLPQNKALDRRFHEILNRQPDPPAAHDPWGSVRASEVPNKPKDKKNSASGTTAIK
jgi:hypothetical protein